VIENWDYSICWKVSVMNKTMWYSFILLWFIFTFTMHTASAITSDDFISPTLNTSLWGIVNPKSDATFTITGNGTPGAVLSIAVPANTSHDVWKDGNNAPRIMQSVSDADFEVEAKFDSRVNKQYQMQGIIIEQDSRNFIRLGVHWDGSNTRIYAANFTPGIVAGQLIPKVTVNSIISPGSAPIYLSVKRQGNRWIFNYSYNGNNWITAGNFRHSLKVTSVGPFVGNAGNPAPAFTGLIDYFFNSSSPIVPEEDTIPPLIAIWYGNSRNFGHIGVPQRWVNIMGNVHDTSGIASLNYSLNGQSPEPLSMGPDGRRLQSTGDFNVELDRANLICGNNQLVINAVDIAGNSKNEIVSINYSCNNVWPRTYSINWSAAGSIQDAAQVVDGLWTKEQNNIRPSILGYDRLVAIGDITWDDYEVNLPITIRSTPDSSVPWGPNVGIIMRWQGHYDWDGKQPRNGWWPFGALGVYVWVPQLKDYRLRIIGNDMKLIANDTSGIHLAVGVPYMFKMRAQTQGTQTLYSLKVWEQSAPEPSEWTISGYGVSGELKRGSLMLNSHYVDASFGNITIKSGPFNNNSPNKPNNPFPNNSSTNQPINQTLSWSGGDPDGDSVAYTVYLDTNLNPTTQKCSGTLAYCAVSGLNYSTTYYWKVVANDGKASSVTGPVWSFTTHPEYSGFVISNIAAATGKAYVQGTLAAGKLFYIDRTYKFTSVPASYNGLNYIKTATDDRYDTRSNFLQFDVNQDVTVYVAYDDRISTKPSWLSSFTDTGDNLVRDGSVTFSIYARTYPAGHVSLGGNSIPSGGGGGMYVVIVQPLGATLPIALSIIISESPDPVTSGGTSQVIVHVTSGSSNVNGVNVGLSVTDGSLGSNSGTTDSNGDFTTTYTAPAVTTSTTHTISATASKTGFTDGSGSDRITVNPASSGLVISNIAAATGKAYVQGTLAAGKLFYIDRTYKFTSVPASYNGLNYIKTATDDRYDTRSNFLQFDVNQDVTVYVAYDDRISTKPSWLSSFTDTGDNLVRDGSVTFSIYARTYPAGHVSLGGNSIPSGGGGGMYVVIVKPLVATPNPSNTR
jgi:hypothetical protein